MAPGRGNAKFGYAGSEVSERSQATAVSNRIRCIVCKQYKDKTAFSKKQLSYAHFALSGKKSANVDSQITCAACTCGSREELKCSQCGKIKGLDEFAKAQRRAADAAKCKDCMNVQTEMEAPVAALEWSDEDDDTDVYDESSYQFEPRPSEETDPLEAGSQYGDSNWALQHRSDHLSLGKFDPSRYGHPASTSQAGRATTVATRSAASPQRSAASPSVSGVSETRGGWAKVKRVKAKPDLPLIEFHSSSEEEAVHSDDDLLDDFYTLGST